MCFLDVKQCQEDPGRLFSTKVIKLYFSTFLGMPVSLRSSSVFSNVLILNAACTTATMSYLPFSRYLSLTFRYRFTLSVLVEKLFCHPFNFCNNFDFSSIITCPKGRKTKYTYVQVTKPSRSHCNHAESKGWKSGDIVGLV